MRKCAELVFIPPRFDVYRAVSRQIQAIFKDYTPLVEPLSLDEAYLDVTDNLKSIPTAWESAKEIRARIYEETKLTASAGVSCNKFLAKLASDHCRKCLLRLGVMWKIAYGSSKRSSTRRSRSSEPRSGATTRSTSWRPRARRC